MNNKFNLKDFLGEYDYNFVLEDGRKYWSYTTPKQLEIALFVEIAEAYNEQQSEWKTWKKNPNDNKDEYIKEIADIVHFLVEFEARKITVDDYILNKCVTLINSVDKDKLIKVLQLKMESNKKRTDHLYNEEKN